MSSSTDSTPQRILTAAGELFQRHGFEGTSLRDITKAAGVSLALVNYHFGSKEKLLRFLIARHIEPINAERIRRLDALEARYGAEPIPLRELLKALLEPFFRRPDGQDGPPVSTLLQARIKDRKAFFAELWQTHFSATQTRVFAALRRTLPDVPEATLHWRFLFMINLMLATRANPDKLHVMSQGQCNGRDIDETLEQLINFLEAGLRA